ncbi:MAG TPA: recombination protein O N-terminal domain-containing protein, partial [Gammaproteobacteria bacterium]
MAEREQVLLEPGIVLHQRPYRDSSQLLECMTAAHGRMGLVARGSRRATTGQRALLQPFAPLKLSWIRRGDLGRLTHVEADAPSYALADQRLLAGFYANE